VYLSLLTSHIIPNSHKNLFIDVYVRNAKSIVKYRSFFALTVTFIKSLNGIYKFVQARSLEMKRYIDRNLNKHIHHKAVASMASTIANYQILQISLDINQTLR
jgi:hypothetical protein